MLRPGDRIKILPVGMGDTIEGVVRESCFNTNALGYCPILSFEMEVYPPADPKPIRKGKGRMKPGGRILTEPIDPGPWTNPDNKPTTEEDKMEKFTATVIRDPSKRTVSIHIEDADGKFLTPDDHQRHERALGAELPLFMSLPEELFKAIRHAVVEEL